MNNQAFSKIWILIIVISLLVGGILTYQYWQLPKEEGENTQKPVVCTQEAKICSDGSVVSRTGPNCEFAECPAVTVDIRRNLRIYLWETYENSLMVFSIKYNPIGWKWKKYQFPESEFSANPALGEKALAMQLNNKNHCCSIWFVRNTPFNRDTGKVLTFKDLVASEKEVVRQNFTNEISEKNIILNEILAVELSYIAVGTQVHRIFIPLLENETFQIGYYGNKSDHDYESEFYQMLSTFRFLK